MIVLRGGAIGSPGPWPHSTGTPEGAAAVGSCRRARWRGTARPGGGLGGRTQRLADFLRGEGSYHRRLDIRQKRIVFTLCSGAGSASGPWEDTMPDAPSPFVPD